MRTRIATRDGVPCLLVFWCPGCDRAKAIPFAGEHAWTWNGDRERPTLSPSILQRGKRPITDDEHARIMAGEQVEVPDLVCHSFVRDGRFEFLGDCTHALAGQTVEIPDWPDRTSE